jgi:hypothetical protein
LGVKRVAVALFLVATAFAAACGGEGRSTVTSAAPATTPPSVVTTPAPTSTVPATTTVTTNPAGFTSPRDVSSDVRVLFPSGLIVGDIDQAAQQVAEVLRVHVQELQPNSEVPVTAQIVSVGSGQPAVVVIAIRGGEGDDTSDGGDYALAIEGGGDGWTLSVATFRQHCVRGVDVTNSAQCV